MIELTSDWLQPVHDPLSHSERTVPVWLQLWQMLRGRNTSRSQVLVLLVRLPFKIKFNIIKDKVELKKLVQIDRLIRSEKGQNAWLRAFSDFSKSFYWRLLRFRRTSSSLRKNLRFFPSLRISASVDSFFLLDLFLFWSMRSLGSFCRIAVMIRMS